MAKITCRGINGLESIKHSSTFFWVFGKNYMWGMNNNLEPKWLCAGTTSVHALDSWYPWTAVHAAVAFQKAEILLMMSYYYDYYKKLLEAKIWHSMSCIPGSMQLDRLGCTPGWPKSSQPLHPAEYSCFSKAHNMRWADCHQLEPEIRKLHPVINARSNSHLFSPVLLLLLIIPAALFHQDQ